MSNGGSDGNEKKNATEKERKKLRSGRWFLRCRLKVVGFGLASPRECFQTTSFARGHREYTQILPSKSLATMLSMFKMSISDMFGLGGKKIVTNAFESAFPGSLYGYFGAGAYVVGWAH